MKKGRNFWISAIVVLGIVLYFFTNTGVEAVHDGHNHEGDEDVEFYTCSMHPDVKSDKEGDCPICGMDLIPVKKGNNKDFSLNEIGLSERERNLAKIKTTVVKKAIPEVDIFLSGKIDYDETKKTFITSYVSGRIENMNIDYTGAEVEKGQKMVEIYSSELITAQTEYLQALTILGKKDVDLAREKLSLLGLSNKQIENLGKTRKINNTLEIYSDKSGTVIGKNASIGKYVKEGDVIYEIYDFSSLWVNLKAYQSDLKWLETGQKVYLEVQAFPGEIVEGSISFISPVLDKKARTVDVRVNLKNDSGKLKPEMIVKGLVINKDKKNREEIIIPDSSPLIAGDRAVVYVEVPEKPNVYQIREVVLGAKAGNTYIVKKGLNEGETIVSRGQFFVDSSMQLLGKKSMIVAMNTIKNTHNTHSSSANFKHIVDKGKNDNGKYNRLMEDYLDLHISLSEDNFKESQNIAGNMMRIMEQEKLDNNQLKKSLKNMRDSSSINSLRQSFVDFSKIYIEISEKNGIGGENIHIAMCPMVPGQNGPTEWIQKGKDIKNPFFGSMMYGCGEILRDLPGDEKSEKGEADYSKTVIDISEYLSSDKLDKAVLTLENIDLDKVDKQVHPVINKMITSKNISEFRTHFVDFSKYFTKVFRKKGVSVEDVYIASCPMVPGQNGPTEWIQKGKDIKNPYFGAMMYGCGEIVEKLINK